MTATANDSTSRSTSERDATFMLGTPSRRLLQAAISSLLAAGVSGCPSDDKPQNSKGDLSDTELKSLCADMVNKAVGAQQADASTPDLDTLCADKVKDAQSMCSPDASTLCADMVKDAQTMCPTPNVEMLCSDKVKDAQTAACVPKTKEDLTTSSDQKEYTFAALTTMCDKRGGYVQIHASCGSENVCTGFSYADWGPGAATLTEHTCAGVNACFGLSCNVLPKDSGKIGADVYNNKFGDPGPGACSGCHAGKTDDESKPDLTKFQLFLHPGSTRAADNWLDRPAAEQERVVAFGVHGVEPGGVATQTMAPYHKVLSRAEIERVVAHLRTLTVVVNPIKIADPAPAK